VTAERPARRWIPWAVAAAIAIAVIGLLSSRHGNRERTDVTAAATSLPASVYFDVGRADLTTSGQRTIQSVASSVRDSSAPVAVTGYTDSSGDPAQNAELAKNRASAVRDALVREGVAPARVVMAPPLSPTPGDAPEASRRVDIKLAEAVDTTGTVR
jgi:outer membrane protein OmpA-like peptidoglycan-associated protein